MNEQRVCPQEPLVLAEFAGDGGSEALSRHLKECVSCQEAVTLAARMRQLSNIHVAKLPPDPEVIWMMAQVSKPHSVWASGNWKDIASLGGAALLAAWFWPAIANYVSSLVPPSAMMLVPMFVASIIAAGLAAFALTTNRLLTDE